MGLRMSIDVAKLREDLKATADAMNRATRPAAQAGAQIIYMRAKMLAPVSDHAHMFYGSHAVYGPYKPGTLRDSIYQAFSKDNSFKDVSTYHISWNADKAPYGAMVEFGTSRAPARSFIGASVRETRPQVLKAMKQAFVEAVEQS